jgi:hypothetical protein
VAAIASALALSLALALQGPAASELTVTTVADVSNGDTSSVAALIATPGPDGVSLREAIEAANNDPGNHSITFAEELRGQTITVESDFPWLTGGGVSIEGDINGDGAPDVTLRHARGGLGTTGLTIASGGNTLHGLTLERFYWGVLITPPRDPFPTGRTFTGNTVSGLVMRDLSFQGVRLLTPGLDPENCPPDLRPSNRWVQTTIDGNTIEAPAAGMQFWVGCSGDRLDETTITDNTIRVRGDCGRGAGISIETTGESTEARVSDVLIARNQITGCPHDGIVVAAGTYKAQGGVVERVRILANRIRVEGGSYDCCGGIGIAAGSDAPNIVEAPRARYLDGNVLRDVVIRGNSGSGRLRKGIGVASGWTGSRNRVEDVRVERNTFRSTRIFWGVEVVAGIGTTKRTATGNRVAGLTIVGNTFRRPLGLRFPDLPPGQRFPDLGSAAPWGSVLLVGGQAYTRRNVVRDVRIVRNTIRGAFVGISLIGGDGYSASAMRNAVTCVRLAGNRVEGTRFVRAATANFGDHASGNRASFGGC